MIVSVYDFVTGPNLKKKNNCKFMHNCDEKSITGKLTGPIRFSLAGAGAIGQVLKSQTSI